MKTATILGASALRIGKYQTAEDAPLHVLEHELLAQMVLDAMADAGLEKSDIGSIVLTLPRQYTRQKYFATFMANALHIACTGTVMEALGNGMTGGLALDLGMNEVLLGRAKAVLVLGASFETATSSSNHANNSMRTTGDVDFHAPAGFVPISWYAMDAMRYMHDFSVTRRELASVAVKNRAHAALNPIAQYTKPITLDDVMAQRPIVEPLGLLEVPSRGDGVICMVIADEELARQKGKPYARLRGRGFYHDGTHQINDRGGDMTAFVAAQHASAAAYAQAGLTPADIDFAEIYAPCTVVEVLVGEALGLTPRGLGARAAMEGETSLGGRIPMSTSGSLLSRGHPAYVTGLYNAFEAFEQLTGRAAARQVRDAEVGLVTSELGNYNAALVHILEAAR